jgi:hypothetical protein
MRNACAVGVPVKRPVKPPSGLSLVAAASAFIALGWIVHGVTSWLLSTFTDLPEIHRVGLSVVAGIVFVITMGFMVVVVNLDKLQQRNADSDEKS